MRPFTYTGESRRAVAFPLGGIGTGSIGLCGDGSLRQWEIWNHVEHRGYLPDSFFALTCTRDGETTLRALQTREFADTPGGFESVPTYDDHHMPEECRALLNAFPTVESTEFTGRYPIAEVTYSDAALPLDVTLEAFSPMIPLDAENSGLPVVFWNFTLTNRGGERAAGMLVAALQNGVGRAPGTQVAGLRNEGYGGNRNRRAAWGKAAGVQMDRAGQKKNDPATGEMFLGAVNEKHVETTLAWTDRAALRGSLEAGVLPRVKTPKPSPPGETQNAALGVPYDLAPGASRSVTFLYAWRFPNRVTHWGQKLIFPDNEELPRDAWVGNAYCERFGSVREVVEYTARRARVLTRDTRRYVDTFYNSSLPAPLIDAAGSQASTLRTEICFRTADGYFYGFEGGHGASTKKHDCAEGCCPMTCTHVWNYEMSLSRLYPSLARGMREIELLHQLSEEGWMPHRVGLPLSLPPSFRQEGPPTPALDGMLGAVLKYRREAERAGRGWARRHWPRVRRLLTYIMNTWDPDARGIITGEQPNTYDIATYGPNTFIGTLYLAALTAALDMAGVLDLGERKDDDALLGACRLRLAKGPQAYDRVWNGEYYQHEEDPAHLEFGWGPGIHSDSLLGQWYARVLGYGPVLPEKKVKATLRAIFKHNFRTYWTEFVHKQRVYITGQERGLLNCSWPRGGRPQKPVPYCDEVWTGIEYEVAALCLYEGLPKEGIDIAAAVRERHDGTTRNPWNEVECGDHYVRAMASWSLLDAASGLHYDALRGLLSFRPKLQRKAHRAFLITDTGWGQIVREGNEIRIECVHGKIALSQLVTDLVPATASLEVVSPAGRKLKPARGAEGKDTWLRFTSSVSVKSGKSLTARW